MTQTPGEGRRKWGWAPAILLIFVTFALGWASAGLIADLLGLGWVKWPLRIGFTAAEAMVIAWLFEPQKGYYTAEQMQGIEFAKWVVLICGAVDGVLLIVIMKFGGGVALSVAQAIITLFAIFTAAGASMWTIKRDPKRIAMVKETTANMEIFLDDVDLRLAAKHDEHQTKRLELRANEKARRDLRRYTLEALDGAEMQGQLTRAGDDLARGIVTRYQERINRIVGLKPPAAVGEPRGASDAPQKRRMPGITVPLTVPSHGDGLPGR